MDFQPVIAYVENVLRKEKGVPGCDLKIMRKHETLLRYQSGVSDFEGSVPVSSKELYHLYSCTKPITCTAGMQLVEKGLLDLEDPVHKYLPEFKNAFLVKDGKQIPLSRTMTIRHLFTMSAGFNYEINTEPIQETIRQNPSASTQDIINALVRAPLQFEPGEQFRYSMCHDVLAAVIEAAAGMRFSEYLAKNIFEPLGMTDTGFLIPNDKKHRLAAQYLCTAPNILQADTPKNSFQLTPEYESGGAGLFSSVDDYSLFADAMANGGISSNGAQILKPETIDLMRTEQMHNYVMSPQFSCAAGPGYGYGLGVRTLIDKSQGQRSSIGEFGWDGAAGSYVMIDPAQKLSIFFAMHVRGWPKLIGCGHAPIRDLTYEVLGL